MDLRKFLGRFDNVLGAPPFSQTIQTFLMLFELLEKVRAFECVHWCESLRSTTTVSDGSTDKNTTFVNCEAWDSGAEAIASSFNKGDLVMLEGSLRNDNWEKDGVKHSSMKVRVSNFGKITKTKVNKQKETKEEAVTAF